MIQFPEPIKNLLVIGDKHYSIYSNSKLWMQFQIEYDNDFLFPVIEDLSKDPLDIMFMGDLFDNKQNVSVTTMNYVIDFFKKITSLGVNCHVLVGNHDTPFKNDISQNMCKMIYHMDRVAVYDTPSIIKFDGGKSGLILPWQSSNQKIKAAIEVDDSDYLFMHNDIPGFFYKGKLVEGDDLSLEDFKKYEKVFSGHIHSPQHKNNIYFVGSVMQFRRSDKDSDNHITYIKNGTDHIDYRMSRYECGFTPKFKDIDILRFSNMTKEEAESFLKNSFVDIYCDTSIRSFVNISDIHNNFSGAIRIELKSVLKEASMQQQDEDEDESYKTYNTYDRLIDFCNRLNSYNLNKKTVIDILPQERDSILSGIDALWNKHKTTEEEIEL